MARYSAGGSRAGINTANSAYFQLRPTSTAERLYVVEVGINVAVAPTTAPNFHLSRSTAVGTSTATLAGQPHEPGDVAAVGTLDSTWSSAPTFSTPAFLRMGGLAVTAGGMLIWTFYDAPIVLAADTAKGLVIANANASGATTGTFTAYMSWDE